MSAPNKSYDPKAVASLAPDEVARVLDEALAAVAAAGTLDELKAARIAHEGDRAPLSLASAEIGALPPEARAEAGRRVGAARGRLREARARAPGPAGGRTRPAGAGDRGGRRYPALGPGPARRAPSRHHPRRPAVRRVRGDGLRGRRGARGRGGVVQLRRAEHPARPPGPGDAGHHLHRGEGRETGSKSGLVLRTHTSPVQIRSMLTRPLPLYVVSPGRTYRHDPLDATHSPVFHQIEGSPSTRG